MKAKVFGGVAVALTTTQIALAQDAGGSTSVGITTTSAQLDADADADLEDESIAYSSANVDATTPEYAGARANRSPDPYEPATRYGSVKYMDRYKPQGNLWEIGLFAGGFFPSNNHNIQVPGSATENYNDVNLALGARVAYFPLSFFGVEAEGMVSPSATQDTNLSAMLYSFRGHGILQLPLASIVPFALVGGGAMGGVSRPLGHDMDPLFHFGVGAKIPFSHLVSLRVDLRDNITQKRNAENGTATHNFEALLGVTFTLGRTPPPPPRDRDYDGLFDYEDSCPDQGALTVDGCPGDQDGDGVPDLEDQCPTVAGEGPTGCPPEKNLDEDGDGVPLPCDLCPNEAGVAPDGCPIKDTDGDGILDDVDKCPTEPETRNGFQDEDGCPDEVPESVKRFTGVIRGIVFDQGKASIRRESFATLDSAYDILKEHESIRLEVTGHTSSEGSEEVNQRLSEERANAVRDYIVNKGIDGSRITARGAGPSEPIADNATPQGREQNRRIEFRILAQP